MPKRFVWLKDRSCLPTSRYPRVTRENAAPDRINRACRICITDSLLWKLFIARWKGLTKRFPAEMPAQWVRAELSESTSIVPNRRAIRHAARNLHVHYSFTSTLYLCLVSRSVWPEWKTLRWQNVEATEKDAERGREREKWRKGRKREEINKLVGRFYVQPATPGKTTRTVESTAGVRDVSNRNVNGRMGKSMRAEKRRWLAGENIIKADGAARGSRRRSSIARTSRSTRMPFPLRDVFVSWFTCRVTLRFYCAKCPDSAVNISSNYKQTPDDRKQRLF